MSTPAALDGLAVAEWSVWTTTARLVVTDPALLASARRMVEEYLAAVDVAASRFRPDSEISALARSRVTTHTVSPLLGTLVAVALEAADATDGAVDPTLGTVLTQLGYGAGGLDVPDLEQPRPQITSQRYATWRDVALDGDRLVMPAGTILDLGATAKAYAADHCAVMIARDLRCGVLLSLGGDLRVAGPEPEDGWNVLVKDGDDEPSSQILLSGAQAVATSSTLHRTWYRNGQLMHHVIDPLTGTPAAPFWRTVSVAASSCLLANTLSTQAIVVGHPAVAILEGQGVAARLVDADRHVQLIGGWPA
ncbi:MAG: rane-associated lipoprotein involved in thiamine biosynthesis [Marmoricola sp.]|nr:rane-associated lipoprotein involved in thiamine biosynthesis [Marmoricola sp.]